MRLILIAFVMAWGASLAMVLSAFLATWVLEWRGSMRAREAADPPDDATGRVLTPDVGLLVPWSGLRASKQRLGVDEAIFHPAEYDRIPEPARDASDDSQAA